VRLLVPYHLRQGNKRGSTRFNAGRTLFFHYFHHRCSGPWQRGDHRMPSTRNRVFISYRHYREDQKVLKELRVHLRP